MTEHTQVTSDAVGESRAPDASAGRGQRRPLNPVTVSRDFMGLKPHDQHASAAAIKAYFAPPKG